MTDEHSSRILHRLGTGVLPLCDVDPDFGRCIPAAELPVARQHLLVAVCSIPQGRWEIGRQAPDRCSGFVVLTGTLMRDSRVGEQWSTELLGPEDVVQPWEELPAPLSVSVDSAWRALEPTRLAVIDRRFARAAALWPQLLQELIARGVRRSRMLADLRAVSQIRRLDDRLILLLRILADRWGYVSPHGVELRLRLTHETVGRLAGARRPSVSSALSRLEREGLLRRERRRFVLPLEAVSDRSQEPSATPAPAQ